MNRKSVAKKTDYRKRHIAPSVRMVAVLMSMAAPQLSMGQIVFSQQPPMTSSVAGIAPNIILSIDDSGSMSRSMDITDHEKFETRIQALKNALTSVFSNPAYLGKFRLAFEAMWNNRGFGAHRFFIPDNADKKPIDNSMQWFDAVHRQNFLDWIQTLTGTGNLSHGLYSTPSQLMIIYAGEYLKGRVLGDGNRFTVSNFERLDFTALSSDENPWNASWASASTTADPTRLSCRRSYFVFMTDGMWNLDETGNEGLTDGGYIYMPFVSDVSGGSVATDANYDGNRHALPDGNVYDPTQPYGSIYADDYPSPISVTSRSGYSSPLVIVKGSISSQGQSGRKLYLPLCDDNILAKPLPDHDVVNTVYPLACSSTLSDFSLYYWATDLQSGMDDKLVPVMPVTADQTFHSGARSAVYAPYWNPKNDPATWQHMQTYTIGYGTPYGVDTKTGALLTASNGNSRAGAPGASVGGGAGVVPGFDGYDATGNVMAYGSFFSQYASGAAAWPAPGADSMGNVYDLVHAAYNGRGKYYPAATKEALAEAFNDILQSAVTPTATGGVASVSASGSYSTSGTMAYAASYAYDTRKVVHDAADHWWGAARDGATAGAIGGWSGALTATSATTLAKVSADADADDHASALWQASVPASAARRIFTASPSGTGIPFEWGYLDNDPSGITQADVDAVRNNPLGDIVDSQPLFVGQPLRLNLDSTYATFVNTTRASRGGQPRMGVVYVGANDGMLHGFDAGQGAPGAVGTGAELMAYVPRGLLGSLSAFGSPHYAHRYWVDGGLFSGDAQTAASGSAANPGNWATVLAGTLGAGGPGYFVLDVTNPASFSEAASTARNLVLIDATDTSGVSPLAGKMDDRGQPVLSYIGNQFGQPVMEMYTTNQSAQIVQINTTAPNGEWALIMGNGYNSASGLPVLLVQSLSKTKNYPLYTVPATCRASAPDACRRAGNGLGAPRPIDVDGNGTADIVYAGDLMGNLWKFDIANPDHAQWNVAYDGQPMFQAVGPTGVAQPIVSAPAVAPNPSSGFMVVFGTGKNLTLADAADTNLNSVYALYDNQGMTRAATTLPGSKTAVGQIALVTAPQPPSFCRADGGGKGRYGACLYAQTGGALGTADANGVSVGISGASSGEQIDGKKMRGWYFDIPDIANGNAGKVLDNPVVMSGNTLAFHSRNVAGHQPDASASPNPAGGGKSAVAANVPAETCDPTPLDGAKVTVNFFDLFTGHAIDGSIDIGVEGVSETYAAGQGNRFQVQGVTAYLPNGPDSLSAVGANISITNVPPDLAGRRVGWHIGR